MSVENDPIRPTRLQSFRVSTNSHSTWHALLSSAKTITHLPPACLNVEALLNGTPSIPKSREVTEIAERNSLFIEGFSMWTLLRDETSLNNTCDLKPTKSSLPRKVCIGDRSPRECIFTEDFCADWPGSQPGSESGNYVSIFVLGWSYIFSARLIELRQATADDKVSYRENMARSAPDNRQTKTGSLELEIHTCDFEEVRWWASILANGCGWQATLSREGQEYFSPWEIHLRESDFTIHHLAAVPPPNHEFEPPSSSQAQDYLFNLARQLDVFDQLICALAGVLMLPTHNRFGAPVTLPRPILRFLSRQDSSVELGKESNLPTFVEISHYMALSSVSGLLDTCLFGTIWQPGVSCNLVSEWVSPALEEILFYLKQPNGSLPVIWAMSTRRPNVAPLWLGAALTGLLPRIFQVLQSFIPTSYPEAAIWSSSPQSFMDAQNHGTIHVSRTGEHDKISREDEFRLLFLTDCASDTYGNPPISPYPPFGRVNLQDTSVEVRSHWSCNHRITYRSWNWKCRDGKALSDFGVQSPTKLPGFALGLDLVPLMWTMIGVSCASLGKRSVHTFQPSSQLKLTATMFSIALSTYCLLPWSLQMTAWKHGLLLYGWVQGALSTAGSTIFPKSWYATEDQDCNDRLSALATRNLFSWTFFTEGVRTEERSLWKHEWLEMMLRTALTSDLSESNASTERSDEESKSGRIQMWLRDISEGLEGT